MSFPAFTLKEMSFLPNSTLKMFSLSGEVTCCGRHVVLVPFISICLKSPYFFPKLYGGDMYIRLYLCHRGIFAGRKYDLI